MFSRIFIAFVMVLSAGCTLTGSTIDLLDDSAFVCSLGSGLEFLVIGDAVQACYSGNSLYFAVENTGSQGISGMSIRLDSDYPLTMTLKEPVDVGSAVQKTLAFGSQDLGNVKSMTITPMVGSGSRMEVCSNYAVTVQISACP